MGEQTVHCSSGLCKGLETRKLTCLDSAVPEKYVVQIKL